MALIRKKKVVSKFYRDDNNWYCHSGLPSDIKIEVDGVLFHLHKFPLVLKCGKIANTLEESQDSWKDTVKISLDEFPGGADTFLVAVKFCYGIGIELTPKSIIMIYCAANFLEMTEEYADDNLLTKSEGYYHWTVIRNWKDCISCLQVPEPLILYAEKLQLVTKCLDALSMMACTDRSLFGWPMMMYGSLQSPGGSILWNGINTGAKIRSSESDWWWEDVSYLNVPLFVRLIQAMKSKGIRPVNLAGAIMYYARRYIPGLGRWQSGTVRNLTSVNAPEISVDQKVLLESIEKLLPEKKGRSYCRFLLGLLRVAIILNVSQSCKESLERRIGMQLELAILDCLLIPSYSDSDTLYYIDCVERIIHHFVASETNISFFSPSSTSIGTSPSSEPMRKVAKLIDNYIAEVASDVNLKPEKIRSLAEALPESSRLLHDGIYRAVDIYLKAHPWLSEDEKEQICEIIDYHKLSIDACMHASQNKLLPLRVVLQVLFFEQLHFRAALTGCLRNFETERAPTVPLTAVADQNVQRDGWVTVVQENQVLKVDLEKMKSKVGELEQEFGKIKLEMQKVSKSHSSLSSPRLMVKRIGSKLLPRLPDAHHDVVDSVTPSPRASVDQAHHSRPSRNRKSLSLF